MSNPSDLEEKLVAILRKAFITKKELDEAVRLLQGELGGFKAEVYNHLHAMENRMDSLMDSMETQRERTEELMERIINLQTKVDGLERSLNYVQSNLRRLNLTLTALIVLNVLVAILLFFTVIKLMMP